MPCFYSRSWQTNAQFALLMKEILNLAVCDRLTYIDFLAKPLQRLTKYPLLLKVVLVAPLRRAERDAGHSEAHQVQRGRGDQGAGAGDRLDGGVSQGGAGGGHGVRGAWHDLSMHDAIAHRTLRGCGW